MNKLEMIEALAAETNTTKAASERWLDAFIRTVSTTVASGEIVALYGFGTFSKKRKAAQRTTHPATQAVITTPAYDRPVFQAGTKFREAVRQSGSEG